MVEKPCKNSNSLRRKAKDDVSTQRLEISQSQNIFLAETPDPEFRALFIASAFNVDWPTQSGESSSVQKQQLLAFLDVAEEMNMNAVMFQVSPANSPEKQ